MDAPAVAAALAAEGVQTRRYYAPPVHRQRAYRWVGPANGALPETDRAAARVLTLPLWTGMADEQVDGVGLAMARLAGRQGRG
jgi:dTDP-4-amino-4,6-dideoxygalactose transaminase